MINLKSGLIGGRRHLYNHYNYFAWMLEFGPGCVKRQSDVISKPLALNGSFVGGCPYWTGEAFI